MDAQHYVSERNFGKIAGGTDEAVVPELNRIFERIRMGEMAVKLRAVTGRFTGKRGGYAAPSGDFLAKVRDFYGPGVYPGAE